MSALTVRELSEKTIRTLKARAAYNHRSLNGEILYIFDYIASFGDNFSFTISRPEDPSVANRRAAVLALGGHGEATLKDGVLHVMVSEKLGFIWVKILAGP